MRGKPAMTAGVALVALVLLALLLTIVGTAWRIGQRPVTDVSETVAQGQLLLGAVLGSLQFILAAVVGAATLYNVRLTRRMTESTFAERRREQAQRLSAWVASWKELPDGGEATVEYHNLSTEPVYELSVRVVGAGGELSTGGVWRRVVRPDGHELVLVAFRHDPEVDEEPTVEMSFTDARGVNWIRRGDGVLVEDKLPSAPG